MRIFGYMHNKNDMQLKIEKVLRKWYGLTVQYLNKDQYKLTYKFSCGV